MQLPCPVFPGPRFARALAVLFHTAWVLPLGLAAQTPSSSAQLEAFNSLRSQFHLQLQSQSQKLTEQYERALARLETGLAETGDYEEALQVKQRRDQLQKILASADSAASLAIPLTAENAKGSGFSTITDGAMTGWRSSSQHAEWTLSKLTPGEYFLELDYLMSEPPAIAVSATGKTQASATALFEVLELSLLAGAADNRRSFELALAANANASYAALRIGPLRFARTPVTLRLAAMRSYPDNYIRMKNIRLVSAAPSVAAAEEEAAGATTPVAESLSTVHATLAAALEKACLPIHDNYLTQLRELARRHPDWAEQLDTEKANLETRLASGPAATSNGIPNLPKPMATLGGISGFQDLGEVTFVPHPENTGDRFRVRHQEREFFIRLLWLSCAQAEPDKTTGDKDSSFSQHFGLSAEDAALFGRAALEFTTGYLSGKTFRLLARHSPDARGHIPALLFLPNIGLYHYLLIDQGLAAVTGSVTGAGTLERALFRSIEEREKEARSRDPRPGAWALSPIPAHPTEGPRQP